MTYGFHGDYQEYFKSIRDFVYGDLEEIVREMEEAGKYPASLWPELKKRDLFRLTMPKKYGGLEFSDSQYFPILEEIAKSNGGIRLLIHGWNGICLHCIWHYGRKEQKEKYLPQQTRGEWMSSYSLTEPGTGTGTDIKATATRDGNSFILNGIKHLISYADICNMFTVFTYTDRSLGPEKGMTAFLVDRNNPGLDITYMEAMGMRGSPHGQLKFKDCVVPAEDVLGRVGQGAEIAMGVLPHSRVSIAVSCLGLAEKLLELAIDYSQKKVSFGKVIAKRQVVQGMLADMATEIAAAKTLIYDTIRMSDAKQKYDKEAAMSKLFASKMLLHVSDLALEVHGGLGYFKWLPVERLYRDARALLFEEGTPTIQRMIIAQDILEQHD